MEGLGVFLVQQNSRFLVKKKKEGVGGKWGIFLVRVFVGVRRVVQTFGFLIRHGGVLIGIWGFWGVLVKKNGGGGW